MIKIGIVAPLNWENIEKDVVGNEYLHFLEHLSEIDPERVKLYVIRYSTITNKNIFVWSYCLNNKKCSEIDFTTFKLIHFLDFENHSNRKYTLKKKWKYVLNKLDILEGKCTTTKFVNDISSIRYMIEKNYLVEYKQKGIALIPSKIINKITINKSIIDTPFIIKPLNGECSRSVFSSDTLIDERYTELTIQSDNFILQPLIKEVNDAEYSMLFIKDKCCFAFSKKTDADIPPVLGTQFTLKEYKPSSAEKNVGKIIYNTFNVHLDIFRVDFVKKQDKLLIMEIESVDPYYYGAKKKNGFLNTLIDLYKNKTNA